jgi:hypothetical protein
MGRSQSWDQMVQVQCSRLQKQAAKDPQAAQQQQMQQMHQVLPLS